MAKSKMNLPNKLTVMRMFMVPVCIAAILIPEAWLAADLGAIIAFVIFAAASITDAIDGKLARKYNLITDFGKFMDPLADKFLVLGSLLAILYRYEQMKTWLFWAVLVVIFREFAVTSIIVLLLEPVIYHAIEKNGTELPEFFDTYPPVSLVLCALMTVFTIWSGVNYLAAYWGYLDPEK